MHAPPATAAAFADQARAPSRTHRRAVMAVLAGLASLTAAHVWINVLYVPWVRPVGALFNAGPASNEGWAAWYVAPLFAAALTLVLLGRYFRRPQRWTLLALAAAGLFAVVFGAWAAYWVKNIGYTWYFVEGASIAAILSVQLQMAAMALGRGAYVFTHEPLLLAIGAVAGVVAALVLKLPLRAVPIAPAGNAAPGEQVVTATPQRAGRPARLATAALMALLGGAVASYGTPLIGIAVAPVAGLIWFFVSFRGGRYAFMNVLFGSIAIALLAALPFTLALATMRSPFAGSFNGLGGGAVGGGGFDVKSFVFGVAVRLPVFVLISVGLIKVALLMSRTTAYALRKVVSPS
jgi:hypothetical protein